LNNEQIAIVQPIEKEKEEKKKEKRGVKGYWQHFPILGYLFCRVRI
jgi:hypothetical protein